MLISKKSILIICLILVNLTNAQKIPENQIQEVENEISIYISEKINDYELSEKVLREIRSNIQQENESIGEAQLKESVEEAADYYKKFSLRVEFFKYYPEKRKIYQNQTSQRVLQTCSDGGFESGLGQYSFKQWVQPSWGNNTGGINIVTTGTNFVPLAPSNTLNDLSSYATLVSPGNDPSLNVNVPLVFSGNRAVRLNNALPTSGLIHVTTMSRNFVVNENFFNFNYSLILEDPNHIAQEQPFFVIRIYDQNDNILRQVGTFSNPADCIYDQFQPANDDLRLYTNWVCDRINVSDLIGQNVRVEFIMADCSQGGHWGKVYIDDICGSNTCTNPLNGTINLNSIPTIECPTEDITICGSYTLPNQSDYDNVNLTVTQNGNNVYTIALPTSHSTNPSGGDFCFDIPLTAFGSNPNGDFEFEVQGNFIRTCGGIQGNFQLDPIFDFSANDSGPDVSFINCITANDDYRSFDSCSSNTFSILDNDTVFGDSANPQNVVINVSNFLPSSITFNINTGLVNVSSSTNPGTYTFNYTICNSNNPAHCDTGTVTILVLAPQIIANNDNFILPGINSCEGGTLSGISRNDTYCGNRIFNFFNSYSYSIINDGGLSGIGINSSNGAISVPPTTPGTYVVTYELCHNSTNNCDTAQVTIQVNYGIIPDFSFLTEICKGNEAPELPSVSNNEISGTWNPAVIDNQNSGIYTFTPEEDCAETITVTVTVIEECGLFLEWSGEVGCQEGNFEPINFDYEDIEDSSCIRVCGNSSTTYTITGNTSNLASVDWIVSGGKVKTISQDGTIAEIDWDTNPSGFIKVIITLEDGSEITMERCIEKLQPPTAYFEVIPFSREGEITICAETGIIFNNLSTTNNGHGDLYYNWDFGNGETSNEFEPNYTYLNSGTYEVTLQVFNGCSCVDEYSLEVKVTEPFPPISCPGVVCEGAFATYSLPMYDCPLNWEIIGGDIVSQNENFLSVHWNQVDEDGMGYVSVSSIECGNCTTSARVPVVQSRGTIKGPETICAGDQGQFSLPQWPTTDFKWSLKNNTTGASLRLTNQRNEIIVQSNVSGTVTLVCNYENTLLGCGGKAEFIIEIKPKLSLTGDIFDLCVNDTAPIEFIDETGNPINNVDWLISGPNGFTRKMEHSPASITFPYSGTYIIDVLSDTYCAGNMKIDVNGPSANPESVNGPTTICPGVPETYSVIVPPGSTAHWNVTNGEILGSPTGAEVDVNFNPSSTLEIEVWFEDGSGCSSDVFILPIQTETIDLSFTTGAAQVCGSSYEIYEVSDTSAETYTWEIIPSSAGSIESGQNTNQIYVLWNQAAVNNVEVKVNARKCQMFFDNSQTVDIIQSPQISINGNVDACTNQPADFNVVLPSGASFSDITWDFGDGITAGPITNATGVTHTYKAPLTASTNYTVTAIVNGVNGCAMSSTASYTVTVSPSPVITVSPITVSACDELGNINTMTLTQQGGFAATDNIQWYKDGAILSGATNPTLDVVNSPGDYYAEVTNSFGCTSTTRVLDVQGCADGENPVCTGFNFDNFAYTTTNTGCGQIKIDITNIGGSYTNAFFNSLPQNATVVSINNPTQIVLGNLPPGVYRTSFQITYINSSGDQENCAKWLEFVIPYSAGLKYNISCAGSGQYNVNLLDYSEYHPNEQPSQYEFTTDGGTSWQSGTMVNGVAQLNTQLNPGTYQVGIRISNAKPACEAYETITLPDMPDANFNFVAGCENEAVQFDALANDPDLTYEWDFGDLSSNLQQDPVKSFSSGPSNLVTLTVTNKYGCSSSTSQPVSVIGVDLNGNFEKSPATACEGETITLSFDNNSPATPVSFEWYKNEVTPNPYAITTSSTLNVTENGQYFAFITDDKGCKTYNIPPISVSFIKSPTPPVISGEVVVCEGNTIKLNIPDDDNLEYTWYRNNLPQTQWNNEREITDSQSSGTYIYTVEATVTINGISCTSTAGSFTVNVVNPPVQPEIILDIVSCSPYEVQAIINNSQPGVAYYWSNGDTGTQTTITHDGPIRVRAEVNNCSASAQIDLPTNLEALAWIFPTGCFTSCNGDFAEGYLIGPLDGFDNWEWKRDQQIITQGSGAVLPLDNQDIQVGSSYSLLLEDYCSLDIGTMEMDYGECRNCDININNWQANCVNIDGDWIYEIYIDFTNNYGTPIGIDLFALNNQGYFINNSALLPPGNSSHLFYFNGQNGFSGGILDISITGQGPENIECHTNLSLNLSQCPTPPSPIPAPTQFFSLQVAPNPVKNYTTAYYQVEGDTNNYRMVLTDLNGKLLRVKQLTALKGNLIFNCSGLASGTYHLSLQKYKRSMKTVKLIVE